MPHSARPLPYWLVNLPEKEWPSDPWICPKFLDHQSQKNIQGLSTPDASFQRLDWSTVQELIISNRIDRFQRAPTDLRKYLEFSAKLKEEFGSIRNFIVKYRLQWTSLAPSGRARFTEPTDYKILYNDWPYGLDPDIVHLVVWTKFELEEDTQTGDLTCEARATIDSFVNKVFCEQGKIPREQVAWFKNWSNLKSVQTVEHFHVMLYRPKAGFLLGITGGDVPISKRVK